MVAEAGFPASVVNSRSTLNRNTLRPNALLAHLERMTAEERSNDKGP